MHIECGINRELLGWLFQWMYNIRVVEPEILKLYYEKTLNEIQNNNKSKATLVYRNLFNDIEKEVCTKYEGLQFKMDEKIMNEGFTVPDNYKTKKELKIEKLQEKERKQLKRRIQNEIDEDDFVTITGALRLQVSLHDYR